MRLSQSQQTKTFKLNLRLKCPKQQLYHILTSILKIKIQSNLIAQNELEEKEKLDMMYVRMHLPLPSFLELDYVGDFRIHGLQRNIQLLNPLQ